MNTKNVRNRSYIKTDISLWTKFSY